MLSKFDIGKDVDPSKPIFIGYHGGCPDGCASALMALMVLKILYPGAHIEMHAIFHGKKKNFPKIPKGCFVFSLDISPTEEDIKDLAVATKLIIADHHKGVAETQKVIEVNLGSMVVNLSDFTGNECGASLVAKMVKPYKDFDDETITMLHKLDVYKHPLPVELTEKYNYFKAFLIQHGERNCSIDLVEQMFSDKHACLEVGKKMHGEVVRETDALAANAQCIMHTKGFRVFLVDKHEHCGPIDMPRYQDMIDKLIIETPTLFLTRELALNQAGVYNTGVRRAGESVDIEKICALLNKKTPFFNFVSAGGHPYAGGVQSSKIPTREELIAAIVGAALYPE